MTHSAGPWRIDGEKIKGTSHVLQLWTAAEGNRRICTLEFNSANPAANRANGKMIAAAPDLLAALEAFLRAPSIGSSGPGSISIEVQTFNLDAARAAIEKARGEP